MIKANKRIEWIDIAKGLSIILVVYGHAGLSSLPYNIGDWFSAFRMPFFFIVSGILFSPAKYPTLKTFISRRWPTLIRPFFIFSFIVLLGYWILDPSNIIPKTKEIVTKGWGGLALWFIPVMVAAQILFYLIWRISSSKIILFCGLIVCGIAGYSTYYMDFVLPHNLCFALTACMLYGGGYLLSPFLKEKLTHATTANIILFAGAMILLSFTFLLNNEKPEFFINKLSSWPTYVAAFGGAMMMCGIAILISRLTDKCSSLAKKLIVFFGKNSYVVLAFHQIILLLLGSTYCMPNGAVQRLLMWLILYGIIYLINTYAPAIIGRKNNSI